MNSSSWVMKSSRMPTSTTRFPFLRIHRFISWIWILSLGVTVASCSANLGRHPTLVSPSLAPTTTSSSITEQPLTRKKKELRKKNLGVQKASKKRKKKVKRQKELSSSEPSVADNSTMINSSRRRRIKKRKARKQNIAVKKLSEPTSSGNSSYTNGLGIGESTSDGHTIGEELNIPRRYRVQKQPICDDSSIRATSRRPTTSATKTKRRKKVKPQQTLVVENDSSSVKNEMMATLSSSKMGDDSIQKRKLKKMRKKKSVAPAVVNVSELHQDDEMIPTALDKTKNMKCESEVSDLDDPSMISHVVQLNESAVLSFEGAVLNDISNEHWSESEMVATKCNDNHTEPSGTSKSDDSPDDETNRNTISVNASEMNTTKPVLSTVEINTEYLYLSNDTSTVVEVSEEVISANSEILHETATHANMEIIIEPDSVIRGSERLITTSRDTSDADIYDGLTTAPIDSTTVESDAFNEDHTSSVLDEIPVTSAIQLGSEELESDLIDSIKTTELEDCVEEPPTGDTDEENVMPLSGRNEMDVSEATEIEIVTINDPLLDIHTDVTLSIGEKESSNVLLDTEISAASEFVNNDKPAKHDEINQQSDDASTTITNNVSDNLDDDDDGGDNILDATESKNGGNKGKQEAELSPSIFVGNFKDEEPSDLSLHEVEYVSKNDLATQEQSSSDSFSDIRDGDKEIEDICIPALTQIISANTRQQSLDYFEVEGASIDTSNAIVTKVPIENVSIASDLIESPTVENGNDLTVSVVTWNLAEESPMVEDAFFMKRFRTNGKDREHGSDLVLISGQECENIKPRRTEGSRSREFRRLMITMLGKDYVPLALHLLGGIQFGLFCKRSLLADIEQASIADVTCGIGNVFHNKGAIGCYLQMKAKDNSNGDPAKRSAKSLRMLFVTAHMAAHVKNTDARDLDFWRIVRELEIQAPTRFLPNRSSNSEITGTFLLESMDRIFFCGDLNYRIDLPREEVEYAVHRIRSMEESKNPKAILEAERLRQSLLQYDQLRASIALGRAFPNFSEGRITFAPTFKFDKGADEYDTSHKQRIPAWTDRILFKPVGTKVVEYNSVETARHSDHRPVFATFLVDRAGRWLSPVNKRRKRTRRIRNP
jgi:hypothetical protein